MDFLLDGARIHAKTGGKAFDPALPTVVFLHGAGMDGTVWSLQSRWFAHHGSSVLALDMPGHGRSGGPLLPTIEAMADWTARVLAALGVPSAALVGHSMGSLVALAVAARRPSKVTRLALIGTALEMKVGPALLAAAETNRDEANAMVNIWSHGPRAGLGGAEMPGIWMSGVGARLLEKAEPGVLFNDLRACDRFRMGDILPSIAQPTVIFQGSRDQMTSLKSARALAEALGRVEVKTFANAGHMTMIEKSAEVLAALASTMNEGSVSSGRA